MTVNTDHIASSPSIVSGKWNSRSNQIYNSNHDHIDIAYSNQDKTLAYQLGHQVYYEKSYTSYQPKGQLIESYDQANGTTIILIKNSFGEAIATITLVFNKYTNLPCSYLFSNLHSNYYSAELTRLAIREDYKNDFSLLTKLMTWAFIYAEHIEQTNQFLIEVNPKHKSFYKRIFDFKQLQKNCKPCPRTKGAPAILMGIDFKSFDEKKDSSIKVNKHLNKFKSIYHNKKHAIIEKIKNQHYAPASC